MKKQFFFPLAVAFVFSAFCFQSCESDDEESNDFCETFDVPDCTSQDAAQACKDSDGTWYYSFNEKKYDYSTDGKNQLIKDMCPSAASINHAAIMKALDETTLQLINEAKVCAICD
jgi:hypothetical protein